MLRENGLPKEEADKIPASGPNGRLLKGDVLAYLGKIEESYNAEQARRIGQLTHLDLSNIKIAAPKKAPAPEKSAAKETPVVEELPQDIALPISLKAVLDVQKRVQESIGVFLPVSTFIARATELANEDLPKSKAAPSADELFDAVLGLDKVAGKKYSRGHFIASLQGVSPQPAARPPFAKKPDILDILAGKKAASARASVAGAGQVAAAPVNVLSVKVPKGEAERAHVFLQRVKSVLEVEPGRLVV